MQSSFISYFEGYDSEGVVIFNGNGTAIVPGGFIDPNVFLEQHKNALLAVAQAKAPGVVRVVIKSLMPLTPSVVSG